MAPDDDYWRWRNAQDDARWAADRASEATSALYGALRRGDHDTARWLTGVPPAGSGADRPEQTEPPTAGEQFREHTQALLFNLRWAGRFLPQELLADWIARVERLDIERPLAAELAAIEAIREEYERACHRYEPPITEVSSRIEWDYHVPRIGHEIEWVAALFRHVMSFEPPAP